MFTASDRTTELIIEWTNVPGIYAAAPTHTAPVMGMDG